MNTKSGLASTDPKSKYLVNKRKFEYIQLVKELVEKCKHFKVEKVVIEDLHMKSKDFGNKSVNRKNNFWLRNLISTKLKMDCKINGIEIVEVNPAYSSVIGNLVYDDFDPISSSREICRRGYYKFQKGEFYPELKSVKHQWKEMVTEDIKNWKELHQKIKILNLRYRVPLDIGQVGCRISLKDVSGIKSYTFI